MTTPARLIENVGFDKLSAEKALAELETTKDGLTSEEAKYRLEQYGPNAFAEEKKRSPILMFLSQLNDPMIFVLIAAAVVSAIIGAVENEGFLDSIVIVAIILINAIVGMVQESKAEKSLEALKKMSSPVAAVKRDGKIIEVQASELVPGDIVALEAGRIVPADVRLVEAINLKIEESALTGESVPVEKDCNFVAEGDIGIGDRINMGYLSTGVSYGRGFGLVVGTGMSTEMGKIAQMLTDEKDNTTPLQRKLASLSKSLGIICLSVCALFFVVGLLRGFHVMEMVMNAISLAVAAIPEGLPAIVTIVLALGVQRMVKVNTIVRKLPSVETLGSVSIVCSDKTGTLTQNKMTVTTVYSNGALKPVDQLSYADDKELIDGFVLCTDATVEDDGRRMGDPTELALVDMGINLQLTKANLEGEQPRINEEPFDSDRKMMTTVHKTSDGEVVAYTKGAIDKLLVHCIDENGNPLSSDKIDEIMKASKEMADNALRVLALAIKKGDDTATEDGLTFVGLVGMIDPPRPECAPAVAEFKIASVITVMITGDHRDTAFAIAKELGIVESPDQCISGDELNNMTQEELNAAVPKLRVFARVSPQHKVMIVKAFKSHGHIVSMTGDGVNDAPSLKAADIGVAMGITGTDVSKGAADMVLTDDNFATIKLAIREGRNIYGNIREAVLFLLSSNLGEIFTMFVAIAIGLVSPLRALHILWINLITDSFPALALGVDPPEDSIMKQPPRSAKAGLFSDGGFATCLVFGILIGAMTLAAFLYVPIEDIAKNHPEDGISIHSIDEALSPTKPEDVSEEEWENHPVKKAADERYRRAQTFAFTTLGISQLFNALGFRKLHRSFFKSNLLKNKMMIVAFLIGFGLQILVTEVPFLIEAFKTTQLHVNEWLILTVFCTLPLWVHEIYRLIRIAIKKNKPEENITANFEHFA